MIFKRYDDLTLQDFADHPVWACVHLTDYKQPWYQDCDEETFRIWTGPWPVSDELGSFLVRAQVVFPDGTTTLGFVTPPFKPKFSRSTTTHPTILTDCGKKVSFWCGAK